TDPRPLAGVRGRLRKLGWCAHFIGGAEIGSSVRARNRMQRCGLELMVRPETARVSRCPTIEPRPLRKPGLFFESRLRRIGMEKARNEHIQNSLHFPRRYLDP